MVVVVAQRIQSGRQELNEISPHDTESYKKVRGLLEPMGVPLASVIQEYINL